MRKRSLAALCTAAALGFVGTIPTAAHAADPHASGFKAWSDEGRIYLHFAGEALPRDLKVHLRKPGTDTKVATVTAFTFMDDTDPCSPSCQDDTGEPARSEPLRLADLGTYAMDVEYDGTLGEPVLHKDKGVLYYGLMARVTGFEVTGTPHFESRTVTVKADAVARDPRNDSEGPLANGSLVLDTRVSKTPVATDAKGHIETAFTFAGTEPYDWANGDGAQLILRPEDAAQDSARGQSRTVKVLDRYATQIALDTTEVTGADGSKVPVTGRATYKAPDGAVKPLPAGMGVHTTVGYYKTGADGRFTAQVLVDATTPRNVSLGASAWMSGSAASVTVDPSASAGFHGPVEARVSADKEVTVTGTLHRFDIPARTTLKVEVQHKAFAAGAEWTTKKTLDSVAPAGNSTATVTATGVPYPGPGHWRLRYVGTPKIPAGPEGASNQLVGRSYTAIPQFNANPEPVKAGGRITMTGKLTHLPYNDPRPAWTGYGNNKVHFYFREAGSTTWTRMGYTRTRSDGTFTKVFTAGKDGTWKARHAAIWYDHFKSASREDFVDVQ